MGLERKIYDLLVEHCGHAKDVKGISVTGMVNLKKGGGMTINTLKRILKENGMGGELIIKDNGTTTKINLFN